MESKGSSGPSATSSPSRVDQMQSLLRIQQQIEADRIRSKLVDVETKLAHPTTTTKEGHQHEEKCLNEERERLRLLLVEKEKEGERIKVETALQIEEERNRLLEIIRIENELNSQSLEEMSGSEASELIQSPETVRKEKKIISMNTLSKSLAALSKGRTISTESRKSKKGNMSQLTGSANKVAPIQVSKLFTAVKQEAKITLMLVTGKSNELVAACADSSIKIINVENGSVTKTLVSHADRITSMAEIGGYLVIGSVDESICIWEVATGRCTHRVRAHVGPVTCVSAPVCIAPPTTLHAVTGGNDGKIKFWNIADATNLATMNARHSITALHLFFNSKKKLMLLCGTSDKVIRQWDMTTHNVIMSYKGLKSCAICIQTCILLAVSPIFPVRKGKADETSVLCATACKNHTIRLLDLESGDVIFDMQGHENVINSINFVKIVVSDTISDSYRMNFDDNILVSSSTDGSVRYWTLNNGKEYRKYYWHGNLVTAMTSANIILSNGEMSSVTFSFGDDRSLRTNDIDKVLLYHNEGCCGIS